MNRRRCIIRKDQKDLDLLKAYRMFQKLIQYPDLIDSMREIFLLALSEKKIVDAQRLRQEAIAKLQGEGREPDEESIREYQCALIDLYFATFFTETAIEGHINLARKQDRFKHLSRVINMEGTTSRKIHQALQEFCEIPMGDLYISPDEAEGARVNLINYFISNQLPFIGIGKQYITVRDIYELVENILWSRRRSGKIGGKAAGMFLAYKVLVPKLTPGDPEIERYVRIPESYYFNSGIFSDFLDYNNLHRFHTQKYKTREVIEEDFEQIAELFQEASFPPDTVEDFREFLQQVGEHPLILRSSSLLEDNFGHAFSGKYDSIFVVNQGDLETRLNEFIWGLKRVHMSTFGPGPILYRRDHNLLDFDERMSVLVQKVVGRRFKNYFFPFSAGVGFSYSSYSWTPRIKKEDGLVRLVFGLGTRAVDRIGQDYPRMVHLSHPLLRPEVDAKQIMKYSQKLVDVLNLKTGQFETVSYNKLMREISHPDLFYAVSVNQDGHLSPPMFKSQPIHADQICLTFENLLSKTEFTPLMKKILRQLQEAYGRPVDIEFAWDENHLYILQCRSLAVSKEIGRVSLPKGLSKEKIIFTNNQIVSSSIISDIEYVVYVCPKAYGRLSTYDEKLKVGRVVSQLNRQFHNKRYALFGPGRWGSNDINLGVKVGYEDINRTLILGEIAFEKEGYTPEVSFGTHFFNDLVEAQIAPIAIFPDHIDTIFKEGFFKQASNQLSAMAPDFAVYDSVVHVVHVPAYNNGQLLHVYQNNEEQKGVGFIGPRE
ncbi:PEP/pyruvate-binding domain-containing protein [Thermodesulfobacteriota bacterium]